MRRINFLKSLVVAPLIPWLKWVPAPEAQLLVPTASSYDPTAVPPTELVKFDSGLLRRLILAQAPLYCDASKIKLPVDCGSQVELIQYSSSDGESTRRVGAVLAEYSDYQVFENGGTPAEVANITRHFARSIAGMLEQSIRDHHEYHRRAFGQEGMPYVVDIFDHADGSPNLYLRDERDYVGTEMVQEPVGWIGYRFKYALACL